MQDRDSENLERIRELMERQYAPEDSSYSDSGHSSGGWLGCVVLLVLFGFLLSSDSLVLVRIFGRLVGGFAALTGG
jgi:hypothetical protein